MTDAPSRLDSCITEVWELLEQIGHETTDSPGITRAAWSRNEEIAADGVRAFARRHGLQVLNDAFGNIQVLLPGVDPATPCVTTGSHLNSVPHGGNYDGLAGIAAGLAVLAAANADPAHRAQPFRVVAMRCEESPWFGTAYLGSRLMLGLSTLDEIGDLVRSDSGKSLRHHIQQSGIPATGRGRRAPAQFRSRHVLSRTPHRAGTAPGSGRHSGRHRHRGARQRSLSRRALHRRLWPFGRAAATVPAGRRSCRRGTGARSRSVLEGQDRARRRGFRLHRRQVLDRCGAARHDQGGRRGEVQPEYRRGREDLTGCWRERFCSTWSRTSRRIGESRSSWVARSGRRRRKWTAADRTARGRRRAAWESPPAACRRSGTTRPCSRGRVFRRPSSSSATPTAATIRTKHWTAKTSPAAFTFSVAPCIDWQTRDEHVGLSLPSVVDCRAGGC